MGTLSYCRDPEIILSRVDNGNYLRSNYTWQKNQAVTIKLTKDVPIQGDTTSLLDHCKSVQK